LARLPAFDDYVRAARRSPVIRFGNFPVRVTLEYHVSDRRKSAAMTAPRRTFLVIDDNVDNRFLLTRTLARKFPGALLRECGELGAAVAVASLEAIEAVILHRVDLADGIETIGHLRAVNPAVPIVMVSGYDRTRESLAAGAARFLLYDEWLRLGSVLEDVLETQPHSAAISALTFAIERRCVVTFQYPHGDARCRPHTAEPHLLGLNAGGQFVFRGCGVSRATRHPLPHVGWTTYLVERTNDLVVTERLFAPHLRDGGEDAAIARIRCQIDGSGSGFIPRVVRR
jgi:CheY-like chemotaxis protein